MTILLVCDSSESSGTLSAPSSPPSSAAATATAASKAPGRAARATSPVDLGRAVLRDPAVTRLAGAARPLFAIEASSSVAVNVGSVPVLVPALLPAFLPAPVRVAIAARDHVVLLRPCRIPGLHVLLQLLSLLRAQIGRTI